MEGGREGGKGDHGGREDEGRIVGWREDANAYEVGRGGGGMDGGGSEGEEGVLLSRRGRGAVADLGEWGGRGGGERLVVDCCGLGVGESEGEEYTEGEEAEDPHGWMEVEGSASVNCRRRAAAFLCPRMKDDVSAG